MYYTKRWILRKIFKLLGKNPAKMPMVSYWKTTNSAAARVVKNKDGSTAMDIEGEKERFPGFPRGHSLYGSLSPLKHQIKNQIFNDSFYALDDGVPRKEVIDNIKHVLSKGLTEFWENVKYDSIPPERMVAPIRELWRVFTKLEPESSLIKPLKEMMCFILQEDDAYRFRVQWLFGIFRNKKLFKLALDEIENAEVISDMKERERLLKRILLLILEDKRINYLFNKFCDELDFKKMRLTKADKYHFRGKYFKCDLDKFEY